MEYNTTQSGDEFSVAQCKGPGSTYHKKRKSHSVCQHAMPQGRAWPAAALLMPRASTEPLHPSLCPAWTAMLCFATCRTMLGTHLQVLSPAPPVQSLFPSVIILCLPSWSQDSYSPQLGGIPPSTPPQIDFLSLPAGVRRQL